MKRWLLTAALLASALGGLAACAAQETAEEAKPAPAPAAAPAPPAAPAAPARPAWQEEWERVLAAAKREGKLAVLGPAGTGPRRAITEPFEKRYGIKVEYQGGRGPEQVGRVKTERAAGQYLWDIQIGGVTHIIAAMKPEKMLDPLEPALILPEVKDPKAWRDGKLWWVDKEREILLTTLNSTAPAWINPKLVKPEEIKSWKDLLDPKWKGKILSDDPRIPGAGMAHYFFFYSHKDLGPDFIRALAKQDLTIIRDRRTALEWLAAGKYPILIGASTSQAARMIAEGLPVAPLDARKIKEGAALEGSTGHIVLLNRAPHPNAAKVYINWFLGREGQTSFVRSINSASLRGDVPTDHLEPHRLPQKGYLPMYIEDEHARRDRELVPFVKEVFSD